jgi:hypothetical protein
VDGELEWMWKEMVVSYLNVYYLEHLARGDDLTI